jgi:cbb3-type cytochrome oxidase maturation protein
MFVLDLTIVLAVIFVVAAVIAFRWAVRDGQLDDLDTPALRMLGDDERRAARRDRDGGSSRDEGSAR